MTPIKITEVTADAVARTSISLQNRKTGHTLLSTTKVGKKSGLYTRQKVVNVNRGRGHTALLGGATGVMATELGASAFKLDFGLTHLVLGGHRESARVKKCRVKKEQTGAGFKATCA
jgi:hypothetical protein